MRYVFNQKENEAPKITQIQKTIARVERRNTKIKSMIILCKIMSRHISEKGD